MGQELRQRAFQPGLSTPGRPEGLEQIKSHEIWICSLLLLWSVVGCPAPVFILRLYFSCLLALVTSGDEDPWNRASGGGWPFSVSPLTLSLGWCHKAFCIPEWGA